MLYVVAGTCNRATTPLVSSPARVRDSDRFLEVCLCPSSMCFGAAVLLEESFLHSHQRPRRQSSSHQHCSMPRASKLRECAGIRLRHCDAMHCAGTNFLIRSRAFQECGWSPEYTMTEDFALGMELKMRHWQVRTAGSAQSSCDCRATCWVGCAALCAALSDPICASDCVLLLLHVSSPAGLTGCGETGFVL